VKTHTRSSKNTVLGILILIGALALLVGLSFLIYSVFFYKGPTHLSKHIPKDTAFFVHANVGEMTKGTSTWDTLIDSLGKKERDDHFFGVLSKLNLSVSDVANVADRNAAYALTAHGGSLEHVFMIQCPNAFVANQLINKIPTDTFRKEKKGLVGSIISEEDPSLTMNFAYTDKTLIFSSSSSLVSRIVDSWNVEGEHLYDSDVFQELMTTMPSGSLMQGYGDIETFEKNSDPSFITSGLSRVVPAVLNGSTAFAFFISEENEESFELTFVSNSTNDGGDELQNNFESYVQYVPQSAAFVLFGTAVSRELETLLTDLEDQDIAAEDQMVRMDQEFSDKFGFSFAHDVLGTLDGGYVFLVTSDDKGQHLGVYVETSDDTESASLESQLKDLIVKTRSEETVVEKAITLSDGTRALELVPEITNLLFVDDPESNAQVLQIPGGDVIPHAPSVARVDGGVIITDSLETTRAMVSEKDMSQPFYLAVRREVQSHPQSASMMYVGSSLFTWLGLPLSKMTVYEASEGGLSGTLYIK